MNLEITQHPLSGFMGGPHIVSFSVPLNKAKYNAFKLTGEYDKRLRRRRMSQLDIYLSMTLLARIVLYLRLLYGLLIYRTVEHLLRAKQ